MRISIRTIPQSEQRYPTVGDWYEREIGMALKQKETIILVSVMDNPDYEFMVAVHELVEQYLCKKREISEESVSAFDTSEYGLKLEDPGADPKAPYHKEHMFSLQIELLLAQQLGVNWDEYESKLAETCPTE